MKTRQLTLLVLAVMLIGWGCDTVRAIRAVTSAENNPPEREGPAGTAQATGQDPEAMRKQLRALGVPEEEIDRTIQQMDEKMKEKGVAQGMRDYIRLLRKRPVKIHVQWQMDVVNDVKSISYRCKGEEYSSDFICNYRLNGRTTMPRILEYVPLSDTERILREEQGLSFGIRENVSLTPFSPQRSDAEVSIVGRCVVPPKESYACDVQEISADHIKVQGGTLNGEIKLTDKGVRVFFDGTLGGGEIYGRMVVEEPQASIETEPREPLGKTLRKELGKELKKELLEPEDLPKAGSLLIDQVGAGVDQAMVQADYTDFFTQLMKTGHFRRNYKWKVPSFAGNARAEAQIDVELVGGPAPNELKPPAH